MKGLPTPLKLGLLATLYLSQGLPFGFFVQAMPPILREQGFSLSAIALTALLALPWALKFLWSPIVDRIGSRRFGRRKAWIVPLQLSAALLLLLIGQLAPENQLHWILVAVFFTNLIASTQDIATDALAVKLLDHDERGKGNGVQVAGYRVGMIIGGGFLLVLLGSIGWRLTFVVAALILLAATVPLVLTREGFSEEEHRIARETPILGLDAFREFFERKGALGWLVLLFSFKFGEHMATTMLRPLFVDLGHSLESIGWIIGIGGFTAGLVGALAGGWLVNQLGRHRALLAFGVFQAVTVTTYLLPTFGHHSTPLLWALVVLEHVASGTATVALFTLMMDRCRIETAARDYSLQASLVVIATLLAAVSSGFIADWLGYRMLFVLSGLVCTGSVIAARIVLTRETTCRSTIAPSTQEV